MVTKEGKEYLEVNLHSPRILTSTRTQGRFGNGHGVEYTEEYFVEYWRPGFNKWVRWRNRRGMERSKRRASSNEPSIVRRFSAAHADADIFHKLLIRASSGSYSAKKIIQVNFETTLKLYKRYYLKFV
ncbi:hypothetical protein K0M31_017968 [Melipona bicolor]|uniref:F5/8 type C domain-containing protein n=1 Tax=Melipona bicolor TaxID=60889 RepID=A0AA40KE97_9HYME|nr:hypothetical protein K0M31_017968 [Melipona bicolor]